MKRERERAKQARRVEKAERRQRAKTDRVDKPAGGEDPDIAGIRPGPQPSPWADMGDLFAPPDEADADADADEADEVDKP